MKKFDIAPFALPHAPAGEIWFEESRDLQEIVLHFQREVPSKIEVYYLQNKWPKIRVEEQKDQENPASFGWVGIDDWFNGRWQKARIDKKVRGKTVTLQFQGLEADKVEGTPKGYNVAFRRTMALRLIVPDWSQVDKVEIYTPSKLARRVLRVELDAGKRTRGKSLTFSGYNARVCGFPLTRGARVTEGKVSLGRGKKRLLAVEVEYSEPAHRYCGDTGLIEFHLAHDTFAISLGALTQQGPIWYAEEGIFITWFDEPMTFAEYRKKHAGTLTVNQRVIARCEHSYARAFLGQPRPHAVAYTFGCKHSPQRYWLEPNGDLLLHKGNLTCLDFPGKAASRFLNQGNARFFFGLESWINISRHADPPPVPIYTIEFRQGSLLLEQQSLAVPLERSILEGELGFDDPTVALLRFRFANVGEEPVEARLPISYSEDSRRHHHLLHPDPGQTEYLVPISPLVPLQIHQGQIASQYQGKSVLRCLVETEMQTAVEEKGIVLQQRLQPGQTCQAVLKIPYLALDSAGELAALKALSFELCHREVSQFWRAENRKGSQLRSPIPQLDTLYAAHLTHVESTDFAMPGASDLINTSVGSSTYGNFSNEACMIIQELNQRGFHDDCRRRLDLWVKYQGTATQPGNFSDYEGMYYGAGGFERGNYNQHHGWVLWCLAEHFLLTRDCAWFSKVVDSVIAGADWIFRQRRLTLQELPHSRGWERGFLPAGSLEDVTEFYYWLSTNCLTWRGAENAARALEVFRHPEASRIRREADAFRRDLIRGFETMRQHAPLVRLRNGRWIPQYPSRLYCRGRDVGWIRQVLEGAVYLLISGLYNPRSKQASWILDDYQDNLYLTPPYGYVLRDPEVNLFNRGGFSIQPCLLAGLMPHLERDEPEIYLWMFFNAFAAVYREEISGMIEHPMPELGISNSVTFKTSDEANAVTWLRYMYVYWNRKLLHFGRALPRAWFAQDKEISITRVSTYFGEVGVRYEPKSSRQITAQVELGNLRDEPQILVRFRHPDKAALQKVWVNGRRWPRYSGEDVDLTGQRGLIEVEAKY